MRALAYRLIICAIGLATVPAAAEDYRFLGGTGFVVNDWLGDGDDRWQSGGASFSWMFGPAGLVELPERFGTLIELRSRVQVITPDNYTAPAAWDRRAAGVITSTVHSLFRDGGVEYSLGAGVAVVGPQTRLFILQNLIHDLTPADDPYLPDSVAAAQIGNGTFPTGIGEAAYRIRVDDQITLRPFVEVQGGIESYARVGADVMFGSGFDTGVLSRDGTTGFPYQTLDGVTPPGLSLILGADIARVFDSALLPAADGYVLTPQRSRVRGGVLLQRAHLSVFYGASWLGPEFAAQPTGQVVSGVQVQLRF